MTLSPPLQNPSAPRPSLEKTPYEGPKTNSAMTMQPDCSLIKEMSKNSTQKYKNHESRKKDHSVTNHIADGGSPIEENAPPIPPQDFGPRRLLIFRHAERVDVTFGKQWIQLSFDTNGCYHQRNLNMPKEIPKCKGGPSDFMKDSLITETVFFQS